MVPLTKIVQSIKTKYPGVSFSFLVFFSTYNGIVFFQNLFATFLPNLRPNYCHFYSFETIIYVTSQNDTMT